MVLPYRRQNGIVKKVFPCICQVTIANSLMMTGRREWWKLAATGHLSQE